MTPNQTSLVIIYIIGYIFDACYIRLSYPSIRLWTGKEDVFGSWMKGLFLGLFWPISVPFRIVCDIFHDC